MGVESRGVIAFYSYLLGAEWRDQGHGLPGEVGGAVQGPATEPINMKLYTLCMSELFELTFSIKKKGLVIL